MSLDNHLCQRCKIHKACYFTKMCKHILHTTGETIVRQAPKGVDADLIFLVKTCPYFEPEGENPDE